jgi:hypothetical protein
MVLRNLLNCVLLLCLLLNSNLTNLSSSKTHTTTKTGKIEQFTTNIGLIPFDELHLATMQVELNDCSLINCPIQHGVCKNNKLCVCNKGYLDVSQISHLNKNIPSYKSYCNYEQKYQIIAFLFELFFPLGFGHLYLRRTAIGIVKLICGFICYLAIMYGFDANKRLKHYFYITIASMYIVIHCFDLVLFGINYYLDGNGLEVIGLK